MRIVEVARIGRESDYNVANGTTAPVTLDRVQRRARAHRPAETRHQHERMPPGTRSVNVASRKMGRSRPPSRARDSRPHTMHITLRWTFAVAALTALTARQAAAADVAAAAPAVFQFAKAVKTSTGERDAFLWVPPRAQQVRGVLFAGMTSAERELVKDAAVRRVCEEESLAIVFLRTGIGSVNVQQVLDDFARASGYQELSVAPLFFVGHSAGGPQAKAAAVTHQARCFGVMQYRGGSPGVQANATDPDPVPPGVPAVMMLGQFDEFGKVARDENGRENWENGVDSMRVFRSADPRNLGSFVVEPGAGHFAWSDRSAAYFALFLRKAARMRIPDWSPDARAPIACRQIDATRGWLTELLTRVAARHMPALAAA